MKIAVLGSAFDPPTLGHLDVIKQCLEQFDEVWLVPAFSHAFNKKMRPYFHRTQMAAALVEDIAIPAVKLVACEHLITRTSPKAPVYSIDLLDYLKKQHPDNQYALVIGSDNVKVFDQFYQAGKLKTDYSPFFAVERVNVRSTMVRQAISKGASIQAYVSPGVANYLRQESLYDGKTTGL